jgi:cystathionine gamma-synthase/methionine-gamma-lyase
MAALHAAWLACGVKRDDVILASRDCYGSTLTLLRDVFERLGVKRMEADLSDSDVACRTIRDVKPSVVHCEIISNPLLRVIDVPAISRAAHEVGARLVLDATFATPVLFRGLEHGADVVVHSMTKYLNGHGDVTGGVCVTNDSELLGGFKQAATIAGAALSPFDAWLTLRGLRTLPLRMKRHCENAMQVATFLEENEPVARVHYPGLPSHAQHDVARRLLGSRGFGGMVAFEMRDGTRRSAMQFMNALRLVQPATTLGDVWSLAMYPPESSHRDLSAEELDQAGISRGLIRLSIGIEDPEDIIGDLEQALCQS